MKWIERIRKALLGQGGGTTRVATVVPSWLQGRPAAWSDDPAEQVRHYKHWVYAAVQAIAFRVAGTQMALYARGGRGIEEISEHPFCELMKRVNPFHTRFWLWADIDGIEETGDGSGSLVENPAEIIQTFLSRWVGLAADDMDADAFATAATALNGFKMAFTLTTQNDALHLCADLAFQARCALLWEDGIAKLTVLRNRTESPALTLGSEHMTEDGLEIGRRDINDLASEVVAYYRDAQETRAVTLRDTAVEAAFGRRVRTLDLWAYADRRTVASLARFWLSRWKYLFEEVRLSTFLPALKLQRNDTVELDMTEHFNDAQRATVREIIHQPGSGHPEVMDKVSLGLRLPIVAGCVSTCETECESSGESGCLLTCEIEAESGCWQCETQCEALCELACTTEAELHCIIGDTAGGSLGGCGACETSCETACETACETGCEIACETACEVTCETGCETTCETGCEISCEVGCETTCESGCEVSCETGCEATCEVGCETSQEVSAHECCGDCAVGVAGFGTLVLTCKGEPVGDCPDADCPFSMTGNCVYNETAVAASYLPYGMTIKTCGSACGSACGSGSGGQVTYDYTTDDCS